MPTKKTPTKGLQTAPDKTGKVKNCTPGKSYPCGKACLGIGSAILESCLKKLKPEVVRKSKDLANAMNKKKVESNPVNSSASAKTTASKSTTTKPKSSEQNIKSQSNDIDIKQLPDPGINPMPKGLEILHTTVPKSLGIPGTSISRIEQLARASKEGKKAIIYMWEDENLMTHLSASNSQREKGGLDKKYADAANKVAEETWGSLSSEEKDSVVKNLFENSGMSKTELQRIANKSLSSTARSIAKDMMNLRDTQEKKQEEEEQKKWKARTMKQSNNNGEDDDLSSFENMF